MLKPSRNRILLINCPHFIFEVCIVVCLAGFVGCDVQRIDAHFQGPSQLSGSNAAVGGVSYEPDARGKSWDRQISACRLDESKQGLTLIRFGPSSNDLPLAVMRDESSGTPSFTLTTPDGVVSSRDGGSCTVGLQLNPSRETTASGRKSFDGEAKIACTQGEKDIHGSVRFQRCGD